jgi:hypothetical protein
MIVSLLEARIRRWLRQATAAPTYPLLVGLVAFGATVSMSVPFGSILVVAVLLRRDKWLRIALLLGKIVKYTVYAWAVARFPEKFARSVESTPIVWRANR